ncbi:Matrilin coiled-coil trimerization domain-containing protein [Dioscorea alata]|uniref:Matrilin coiled-coil trimerization domain-containing protein n=1 Tax=Dioscorea alata TaxID=55571 RepID=A0ACB7WCD6_DIOAL|nr:Matrilin coiled-coil trimerization domain-containing protein [Dioscorea alata]
MMSTLERKEGGKCQKGDEGDGGSPATVSTTTTTTNITMPDGQVLTLSDFISRFDEAAKRRVEVMKQKLMYMEMQMEAIENEMSKANGSSNWN